MYLIYVVIFIFSFFSKVNLNFKKNTTIIVAKNEILKIELKKS